MNKFFEYSLLNSMVIEMDYKHFEILEHNIIYYNDRGERSGTVIFKEHDCSTKYILDYNIEDVSGTYEDTMYVFSPKIRDTYDFTSGLVTVPEYHDTTGWQPPETLPPDLKTFLAVVEGKYEFKSYYDGASVGSGVVPRTVVHVTFCDTDGYYITTTVNGIGEIKFSTEYLKCLAAGSSYQMYYGSDSLGITAWQKLPDAD